MSQQSQALSASLFHNSIDLIPVLQIQGGSCFISMDSLSIEEEANIFRVDIFVVAINANYLFEKSCCFDCEENFFSILIPDLQTNWLWRGPSCLVCHFVFLLVKVQWICGLRNILKCHTTFLVLKHIYTFLLLILMIQINLNQK